jgi:chitin-binding protein
MRARPALSADAPDTTQPSPRRFHVKSRSGERVTFKWRASSDNVGVVKYKIYREGRKRAVGVTTGTSIRIHTRFHARYFVRAFDAAGNRSYASRHVRGR